MSRENVNPNFKFGDTDGFMLTDIDTDETLMLIPCDTAGNFSWTGVTRAPLTRNAMQTSNTSNQYSDLELPWISIPQEDWTGGRANDTFTKDTTRYRDGKRAQAAYNQVIYNGPLDYYSTGFRTAITNCPGSMSWKKMLSGAERFVAVEVKPENTFQAGEIYIHLRRRGNPKSHLIVELVNELSSEATVYASHEYTTDEITDTLAEFAKFTFNPVTLTEGNTYYIRVYTTGLNTSENYWQVGTKVDYAPGTYYSKDGDNYYSANFELYFRIAEQQTGLTTKFFMYEQLMFMVRQMPNGTPTLWMNGDIGAVTSATSTTVTASKSWVVDAYAGAKIGLVYRNGSHGKDSVWRTIVSNTADSITVDEPWDITPTSGCVFIIVDTPLWTEITGHGLTATITDIHVIRGVVYFAQCGIFLCTRLSKCDRKLDKCW